MQALSQRAIDQGIGAYFDYFASLLRGCRSVKTLKNGKCAHRLLIENGLELDVLIGTSLLKMYANCGRVLDARRVFDTMTTHNVVSWTALITTYAKQGDIEEAFTLFEKLQFAGLALDNIIFVVLLKACTTLAALERGKHCHVHIIKSGFESDISLGNSLIDMYVKCGSIGEARLVFDKMCKRNVVSWTTMIAGYAHGVVEQEAFVLFALLQEEGIEPNNITFVSILKACASLAALEKSKQVHVHIITGGFELDICVGNILVDVYVKCGNIEDAHKMFNRMLERDVVSWTTMISGYAQGGICKDAIILFEQLQQEGTKPDNVTLVSILKACASLVALEQGQRIHAHLVYRGCEPDVLVWGSLIDMYAKCGRLKLARQVFDEMCEGNIVLWNSMITGYAQAEIGDKAIELFKEMQLEGVTPDRITYLSILMCCLHLKQIKHAHTHIINSDFESDMCIQNSLIDMYANSGSLETASQIFHRMVVRDGFSWNAMIAGHTQHGFHEEALILFKQMQEEGVKPDIVTFPCILKACASLAALEYGKQVHRHISESAFEVDVFVNCALVGMYAKCGSIEDAHQVFNDMRERNVVSWNAIIAGFAQHGFGKEALELLRHMQEEGIKPDAATFLSILAACSHSALVNEGCHHFNTINQIHNLTPARDHHACMVDILSRVGHLDEAMDFINKLPIQPDFGMWMTLLSACRNHGNAELGKRAFNCALKLKPKCAGAYLLLSSLYSTVGSWDELAELQEEMEKTGVKEELEGSWNEVIDGVLMLY